MAFFIGTDIEFAIRLILAVFFGGLIGIEREVSHKPAGLRTHMLVSIGSALFTIMSIDVFGGDPARVAANIVTGIGFIGGGSIIASRGHIHGITTAASLWATAAIGLGVGAGAYTISAVGAFLIFVILNLKRMEKQIGKYF
ncbi:MAG TPA: MgtC/SapB family protein [archaeon]|nr:MgtC/SapB family protein [archaeon]